MIGLLLHAAARIVDRARTAAAPLGWVWTYGNPSRQQLREEASYWRAIARLTDDKLDEARAEREEWQRRAVAAAQSDLATTVRYTALQAAVRDLAAAHRACEDDLARAEETGKIARLDLPILRAEAWDRLLRLAGVEP